MPSIASTSGTLLLAALAVGTTGRAAAPAPTVAAAPTIAPAVQPAPAPIDWVVGWNSRRDGNWEVYARGHDGSPRNLSTRDSNEWAWGARAGSLLLLSNAKSEAEPKGWRPHRLDGGGITRTSDTVVGDGFLDCLADGSLCVAEVREGKGKRIARFDRAGVRGALLPNPRADGEDADPQLSPDGRTLLFRSNRSGSWELWLADVDGSDPRMLTREPANDAVATHAYGGEGPARFSPDGTKIVWMRESGDDGADIWVMNVDGSDPRNLTAAHAAPDGYPVFSPDGTRIAFDSKRDGDNEIYVMGADGKDPQRITQSPGPDLAPVWVPAALLESAPAGAAPATPQ